MVFNYTHVAYTIKEEILLIIASTRITTINQQLSIKDYNSQQKRSTRNESGKFFGTRKIEEVLLERFKKGDPQKEIFLKGNSA